MRIYGDTFAFASAKKCVQLNFRQGNPPLASKRDGSPLFHLTSPSDQSLPDLLKVSDRVCPSNVIAHWRWPPVAAIHSILASPRSAGSGIAPSTVLPDCNCSRARTTSRDRARTAGRDKVGNNGVDLSALFSI